MYAVFIDCLGFPSVHKKARPREEQQLHMTSPQHPGPSGGLTRSFTPWPQCYSQNASVRCWLSSTLFSLVCVCVDQAPLFVPAERDMPCNSSVKAGISLCVT